MESTDWVAIRAEKESQNIVHDIEAISTSPLYKSSDIGIYMISAALALKHNIKPIREYQRETDVTNKNLITEESKWFMCMLYYSVDKGKDLKKLRDKTAVVKNFEQYAQAGLAQLYEMCKDVNCQDELKRMIDAAAQ